MDLERRRSMDRVFADVIQSCTGHINIKMLAFPAALIDLVQCGMVSIMPH